MRVSHFYSVATVSYVWVDGWWLWVGLGVSFVVLDVWFAVLVGVSHMCCF